MEILVSFHVEALKTQSIDWFVFSFLLQNNNMRNLVRCCEQPLKYKCNFRDDERASDKGDQRPVGGQRQRRRPRHHRGAPGLLRRHARQEHRGRFQCQIILSHSESLIAFDLHGLLE